MPRPHRLLILAAFAALYVIWGSTYLAILFAIKTIPPLLMAGARFLLAGFIMYAIARGQGAPKGSLANWRTALIIGGCLLLGGNGGVTLAEQYVSSGLASVMVATVPIYIALLAWWSGIAPRPTPIVWLGLAGGFAGVAILLGSALHFLPDESRHPEIMRRNSKLEIRNPKQFPKSEFSHLSLVSNFELRTSNFSSHA
ncbi:MAG: hypothetical protein DME97_10035 [Verrucomicrobia bacterium]|nr:MAG: hypothetical protein DME97_10035 [Verrucomicrobiota bacterium]